MPSFNQQAMNNQFYSSNQIVILIGSQEIGFGQTASANLGLGAEQFYQIGTALPGEIQQLRYSPSITLNYFKLTDRGLGLFGYTANTPLSSIIANNKFNLAMNDNNGNLILTFLSCSAASFNMSVPANAPVTEDIDFLALDILDANGVTILNGNFALNYNNGVPSIVGTAVSTTVA